MLSCDIEYVYDRGFLWIRGTVFHLLQVKAILEKHGIPCVTYSEKLLGAPLEMSKCIPGQENTTATLRMEGVRVNGRVF